MALLLLDIGNTRIKWGVMSDDSIAATGSTRLPEMPASLPSHVDAAVASNVAGDEVATRISATVLAQCDAPTVFVSATASAAGVHNSYADPASLGVDRWMAMIGARALTDSACLVVDAGTAITLDALDADGQHLGGQILPGLGLMAQSLGSQTSDLPHIGEQLLSQLPDGERFGRSTDAAIAQGLLGAAVGAIELAIAALPGDAELILTGGDASVLQSRLAHPCELREHLVLEGLARLSADGESAPAA